MTLIIGLNFSDKLYVAGDTRVTRCDLKTGEKIGVDNVIKVTPLWSKGVMDQPFYNRDSLIMAVAGDVEFATFIYEKIKKSLGTKELNSDVRVLNEQILDYIRKCTDEWLIDNPFKGCAFIISGMTQRRKKVISKEKLDALVDVFEKSKEQNKPFLDSFLNETLPNDAGWKAIQEKIKKDSGKTVEQMLAEGSVATIPDWIKIALENNIYEIDMPDSLLIGVDVRPMQGILKKETAEWGEFLAYGAGLSKDDLPQDLLANIELSHVKEEKLGPHLLDGAMITNTIEDIAREKGISSIGGSVVLMYTKSDNTTYIQGKDLIHPTKSGEVFKLKLMGHVVPLISFHKYPKSKSSKEKAEM